jgi:hypothetical protein
MMCTGRTQFITAIVRAEGKAGQKGMRLLRDCLETKYFNTVVLEYHGI